VIVVTLAAVVLALIAVGGGVCGVVGLVAGYAALRTLRRLRRSLALLQRDADGGSFAEAAARQVDAVDRLRVDVAALSGRIDDVADDQAESLRRVGLVRYDAFAGGGGRMSWSAALLDIRGDGVVLTAITGRAETRAYAKSMAGGRPSAPLSSEEQQAVSAALGGPARALRKSA